MRPVDLIAILSLSLPSCAQDATGPASFQWQEPVEVAAGEAHAGPWRMNDSDFRYVDDPTVALSPSGDTGIAWVDQESQEVFFQRYSDDGKALLGQPTNVSRSPDIFSWLPRLIMRDADHVFVLWQEIIFSGGSHGGEILFARSTDGGRSFSEPVNLSNTPNGAGKGRLTERYWHNGSLDLATGPEDALYAAWTEYQGPLKLRRSTDAGRAWSDPMIIAGGEGQLPARGPAVTVGPDERVHLAWTVGEDPAADIRYAVSDDGGRTFPDPRAVAASDAHADAPKVAVHRDGTVHLAWMESPGDPFRNYEIRYTRKRPDAEDFPEGRTVSAPLPDGFAGAGFPNLELDSKGNPLVLFELFRGRSRRGGGLGLACSGDGGQSFTAPTLVPRGTKSEAPVNGSRQGLLMDKLAVDPGGGVTLVNSTFEEGKASHVWLVRGDAVQGTE